MNIKTRIAVNVLNDGGIISIPTDTIQGLSCLPRFDDSLQKLVDLKKRSVEKGLILLASDPVYFQDYVEDISLLTQLTSTIKDPITYLLKASDTAPQILLGGYDTIAIRLTTNPLIMDLCKYTQSALVSTSANISGLKAAKTTLELRIYFKDQLDYIIAPNKTKNSPSSIINLQTGERLR